MGLFSKVKENAVSHLSMTSVCKDYFIRPHYETHKERYYVFVGMCREENSVN
jgi:hypothetical protein